MECIKGLKLKLKILLLSLATCFMANSVFGTEITIFDCKGNPIAYIAPSEDYSIYQWDGHPVAYLKNSKGDDLSVYGFNGDHLGWISSGVVRDHEGYAVGFFKGKTPVYEHHEPYKYAKKYRPARRYPHLEPYKPNWKNTCSTTPLELFLFNGAIN